MGGGRDAAARRSAGLIVGAMAVAALLAGLSPGSSAAASRDGQIAVVDSESSAGLSAIVLIPSDRLATKENSKVLVSGPGTMSNLQWTPDGKTLVYDETAGNRTDLYAVDVASPRRRLLAAHLPIGIDGALSPDGKTVAYWIESGPSVAIELVGIDGQSRRKLIAGADPAWSPDGSRLALLTLAGRIATTGVDGSGTRPAGRVKDPTGHLVDPTLIGAFTWEPRGQSFLVVSENLTNFTTDTETIAANGTALHVLSRRSGLSAAWSPDGAHVAFTDMPPKTRGTVVVANADGSSPRTVDTSPSSASGDLGLAWSPDGSSIVTANGDRVRVVDPDGTHAKVIAYPGQDHEISDPAWQPLS